MKLRFVFGILYLLAAVGYLFLAAKTKQARRMNLLMGFGTLILAIASIWF
jgi:hypothetical protein